MNKFKIGDKAWSIANVYYEVQVVKIDSEREEYNGVAYYNVIGEGVSGNRSRFPLYEKYLFNSKEKALAESNKINELQIEEILSKIKSIEDLLNTMIKCMPDETKENRNYIKAVKRKAKELLGIELQGEIL